MSIYVRKLLSMPVDYNRYMNNKSRWVRSFGLIAILLLTAACGSLSKESRNPVGKVTAAAATLPTSTPLLAANTPTASPIPENTPTVTPTVFTEAAGCLRPPDDISMVEVNGQTLNRRTLWMLSHAAELYGGVIDIEELAIVQGSYTAEEPLSFGTHGGGGAVDLSVISRLRWEVLEDEIDPLLRALRVAGFAAWLRAPGELAPGSPIHIHAIAIGDPQLSAAAIGQLTGEFGYFRGYNGLPQENGIPIADSGGEMVLCRWMLDMGYQDLRPQSD